MTFLLFTTKHDSSLFDRPEVPSDPGGVNRPSEFERDGYVPNVVYSCGALKHRHLLLLPFGIADQSIGVAVANLDDLLDRLVSK